MVRHRLTRAVLVPLAIVLAVACERGEDDPSTTSPTWEPSTTSTIAAPPGSFRYEGLGVAAVLRFEGTSGTLEVRNDTDVELGEPHLYVFRADDGARVDLTTDDPAPVDPGPKVRFRVAFDGPDVPPIGMVFLMFGEDDFGAFIPVRAGGDG